jgi:uncharacterized RDD family membrane protein YckC
VSALRCPRCHREAPLLTAFCAGCGAPLLLGDDAPGTPLAAPVDLDRRSRGRPSAEAPETVRGIVPAPPPSAAPPPLRAPPAPAPAPRSGSRADELAEVEHSHWDLGPLAAGAARPEPRPANVAMPTPPPRNVAVPAEALAGSSTAAPSPRPSPPAEPAPVDDLPDADVDELEVHVARADPWRRAVAWLVDGVPFLAVGGWLGFRLLREAAAGRGVAAPRGIEELVELIARERVIAGSVAAAVALVLATYATLAHTLGGATLGKRLVGIRVVGPDGGPPSPARSAIRSLLAVGSAAFLGLGFLLALFTRTGRALHDLVARTWVVKAP